MTGQFSKSEVDILVEQQLRDRRAFWVSLASLILFGVSSIVAIFFLDQAEGGGWYILGPTLVMVIFSILAIWFSRRGRTTLGIGLLLGYFMIAQLTFSATIEGLGLLNGIGAVIVISAIASVTLPPILAGRFVVVGIVWAIAGYLIDTFGTYQRPVSVVFPQLVYVFIILGLLIYLGFVIRNFGRYRIQTKLLIILLGTVLISVLSISVPTTFFAGDEFETQAQVALENAAKAVSGTLDDYIQYNINSIVTEAQLGDIVEYLELPADERAGSEAEEHAVEILDILAKRDLNNIGSYALLDSTGLDVIDSYSDDIGIDKSNRDYFINPMTTGVPYVSPIRFSPTSPDHGFYIGVPVKNEHDETLGVLRVRFRQSFLQTIITENVGIGGPKSFPVLLDEFHVVLAHGADPSLVSKTPVELEPTVIEKLRAENRLLDIPTAEMSMNLPEVEAGLNQYPDSTFLTSESTALGFPIAASISGMDSQPWLVAFVQPQDVFSAPVDGMVQLISIVALAVMIVVALLSVMATRIIANPIVSLTDVAQQVAEGDLSIQADASSQDEVGFLAEFFNNMTSRLRETLAGLEQQVAERTRALETTAEVSRRLSTILDQQQLVREVVEQLAAAFDYYHAHIYLFDNEKQNLVMAGGTGDAGRTMLARGHSIEKGRGLVGQAAEKNEVVLIPDVSLADGWLPNPLLPETKSEIAVPISIGPNVLGVLDVQHNITGGLTEQDADLIQSLANQVAIAVQNAQAYTKAQRQAVREAQIASINQRIQAAASIDDVLKLAVSELGRTLGAKSSVELKVNTLSDDGQRRYES